MIYKPTKKVTKPKLDPAWVRNKTVPCKANDYEIETITALAAECGMYTSAYMLSRALNYEPHARLSDEERALLKPLEEVLTGYTNFKNALNVLTTSEKKMMFHRHSFMIQWLKEIHSVALEVRRYFETVKALNDIPRMTAVRKEAMS